MAPIAQIAPVVAPKTAAPTVLRLNAAGAGTPISPLIYGVNVMEGDIAGVLSELNAPLNRWGGNASTRYNWKLNAANRGNDWFYESVPEASAEPGGAVDAFIAQSRAAKADQMITIPMIGWVGKLGPNCEKLASFSVAKYGAQDRTDAQFFPDAGTGLRPDGKPVKNDPQDANVRVDSAFMADWVRHLKAKWGAAGAGGVKYLLLDNEAGLWSETHRDVAPEGPTMREMRDRYIEYSAALRRVDPSAKIVGPEEWGWNGIRFSPADQHYTNSRKDWSRYPDREKNGNQDYLSYLLSEFKAHQKRTGQRVIDVFTVHYYPQAGVYSEDVSPEMQLERARATRSLWDENWVDESWIKDKINFVPRLKKMAQAFDPSLQIGITEYSFGADNHISGALAQAEATGIFGREGLHITNRWMAPAPGTLSFNAMKLVRNYNGRKSGFGDRSLPLAAPDPDAVSAFAAKRSADGALTVFVLNKRLEERTPLRLQIAGFSGQTARHYQLTATNKIETLADVTLKNATLEATLPLQSLNLFVIPKRANEETR